MLAKRIIPCLDVKEGKVVKGVQFANHRIMGDIIELAAFYAKAADELVFYDITASCENRRVEIEWINQVAKVIDIPFCVAGGVRSIEDAEAVLKAGADKISINSPALENPNLINTLANVFGCQCIVIGVDSFYENNNYYVYQYTGDTKKTIKTKRMTQEWLAEVQDRGAGEIVLNCMNCDGMRKGYDVQQLSLMRSQLTIPLIASGGAGQMQDFLEVFQKAEVDGALAATVFHSGAIEIPVLKKYLAENNIEIRL